MSFSFFLKIHRQQCNCSYSLSVHLFPWDSKHTDPDTQQSEWETVATFMFPTTDIWARHDKTFFSSAEPVCYVAAGVPRDFCWVHFLCLLRQHRSFHLWRRWNKNAIQSLAAWLLCSPEKCVENPKLALSSRYLWSGENYPPFLKIKMSQL